MRASTGVHWRRLAAVVATAALSWPGPRLPSLTSAAVSDPGVPVRASFFGVHHSWLGVAEPRGWPQGPAGSVRLWDNGVTWRDLEPADGMFTWDRLDALVAQARGHGASVLLVLGQTPAFHANEPAAPGFFGGGATSMPNKAAWLRYVQAVAGRNVDVWGGRVAFQVWNEGNNPQYWSGTPEQLALLTRWTARAMRAIDPTVRIVAPAMDTRLASQLEVLREYVEQRPSGRPVADFVDAFAVHLYPPQDSGPERAIRQLRTVLSMLADEGVTKPVWNTEINYGLIGGSENGGPGSYGPGGGYAPPEPLPDRRQAAFVLRTYLLNAGFGVRRVYWYAWDRIDLMNTWMVQGDYVTPTVAGQAFGLVRSWIGGTRALGCERADDATRTCQFVAGGEVRTAVWNPWRTVTVVAGPGSTSYDTGDGVSHRFSEGEDITVGELPVLLRSAA